MPSFVTRKRITVEAEDYQIISFRTAVLYYLLVRHSFNSSEIMQEPNLESLED